MLALLSVLTIQTRSELCTVCDSSWKLCLPRRLKPPLISDVFSHEQYHAAHMTECFNRAPCTNCMSTFALQNCLKSVCVVGADLAKQDVSAQNVQPSSRALSTDVSRFMPRHWTPWLDSDAVISTQAAHSHLHNAGAVTAKVLDECCVLSNVLRDEINKTVAHLQ